jgi:hypothetical protein
VTKKQGMTTNTHPVTLLRSWLRYQRIPFAEGLAPPVDLIVGEDPNKKCVHVTIGPDDPAPRIQEPPGLNIDGSALCYGNQTRLLEEWWLLLSAVGVQEPLLPFNRGDFFEDKYHRRASRSRDGHELVEFRHNTLERSPNPDAEQMRNYKNVVDMATKIYWKRNRFALKTLGYEYEEILTYAWMWMTSYIANYERLPADGDENKRLSHNFLNQRFDFLWKRRHELQFRMAILPQDDVMVALGQEPLPHNFQRGHQGGRVSLQNTIGDIPEGVLFSHERLLTPAEEAQARLEERLRSLPHDEALDRLRAAMRAVEALEKDVRLLARQNLKSHYQTCVLCKGTKVDKWVRGRSRGTTVEGERARPS